MQGVFKGMTVRRALAVCPDLALIEPDVETVGHAFRAAGEVVSFYTPLWEPVRSGHIYLDMTGTDRLWGKATDAASRISREIETRTGLSATIGVAGNKTVSSIASRIKSNASVMDVEPGTEAAFLAPLRVSALPGIGFARTRLLENELAIERIGQIAALDPLSLSCLFGRDARMIHDRARGIDPTPVTPPEVSPTVRETMTFDQDTNDDFILLQCLHRMVETCSRRMRDRSIHPGWASVRIRYSDRVEASRRCRFQQQGFSCTDLYPPVEAVFMKAFSRRVRIRHIEVVFHDLKPESSQLCLFDHQERNENKTAAITAIDRIRHRYGEEAIRFGRSIPFKVDARLL
jgi:DNA polymerase IV